MKFKRKTRNLAGWLLGNVLILLGYVQKAKRESFKDNVITSIYFHDPDIKVFKKLIQWLMENKYVFITSDQLSEILRKKMPCPNGACWITFDDGWKNNIDHVLPIISRYNIPITIFIPTQPIIEGMFWWTKVSRHLSSDKKYIEKIKRISNDERVKLINSIDEKVSYSPDDRVAMTINEIRYISEMPQVTIGSHTVNHPILPYCSEDQVEYEIRESQLRLNEWTGKKIKFFSYPNGDFGNLERKILKKYGYELAATTVPEFAHSETDHYLIPRCCVNDDSSFAENLCQALGVWQPVIHKFKKIIKR
jgi:peptidoglycan/xylan/chitin deacetylase (PgdA/CDA1 family)